MGSVDRLHVGMMRSVLRRAEPENGRMVAAAIGGHLSRIAQAIDLDDAARHAADDVRDATLDLLRALLRGDQAAPVRDHALQAVDQLETALLCPDPAVPAPEQRTMPANRIREFLGHLAAKVRPPVEASVH